MSVTSCSLAPSKTGVAIGIFSNSPKNKDSELTINYKLISNSAKAKLNYLNNNDIINILDWTKCDSYQDTFLPIASNKYSSWISLKNIFPWQHSGTQFKRLWPIAESKEVLVKRWKKLVALPKNQRAEAFIETDARLIADSLTGSKSRKYTGIENLNEQSSIPRIERYAYRSMDLQWCILDERVADRIRPPLVKVLGPKQVFGATLMTKPLGYGPSVSVTLYLPDMDIFCNRGAKDIFPLWKDSAGKVPNVTENLLSIISNIIGLKITPEFLFCYTVAILGSPNYFLSFENDLLSTDIKIPITKNSKIFSEGIKLGAELIWFQTFGERWLGVDINYNKKLVGKAKLEMEIPSSREAYPNKYEYNKELETLKVGDGIIINVVPEVYNYSLSGFKVIESWIKYRLSTKGGKAGKSKSRSPLDKIRPNSWIFTDELLRLLWSVEGCVNLWPKLGEFLNDVISDNYFISSELPEPSSFEKKEPHIDSEIQGILF